jgi:uncharacterized membrane protein YozB (DUF420 family)
MSRPMTLLLLAVLATPFAAWGIYRLAKGLGFLEPAWNAEHEHRRTIVVALFAFELFLSIFLFGHANAWPRVWAVFGVINGLVLVFFATVGVIAARRLWKLRHPETDAGAPPLGEPGPGDANPAEKPLV